MSRVVIIPARGGSKRIPRKNIKPFLGQPMISYPIGVLRDTGLFDRIIVSTDDKEIAEVALKYGAEVPFLRPAEFADDHASTADVLNHALDWLSERGEQPDYFSCVYATTPFLSGKYLAQCWDVIKNGSPVAFSVTSFSYPVQRAVRLLDGGGVEMIYPEYMDYRSQDLEPAYHDAGQFYWWKTASYLKGASVFSRQATPIVLPRYLVQDIDDEEDWLRAELMYRAMQMSGTPS